MLTKRYQQILVSLLLISLLCLSSAVDAAGIKERMAARIPALNTLKNKGVVGENNKGLLEFRGPKEQLTLVTEENKDRLQVYATIAKSQGVNTALVGQRRAAQIAEKGSKGQWFQHPNGNWYQK